MCDFHLQHLNIFHKLVLTWLLSVIIFEIVLCSTHDVHRFVFKSHQRKNRERGNYRYHPSNRQIRKPIIAHAANEDKWPSESIRTVHQYYNYRPNYKNESYNDNKRGKFRNYTTVKSLPLFDLANGELTTIYPAKLPIPLIESSYKNYYPPLNNSLEFQSSTGSKQQRTSFTGNVRELREQETSKNVSKGYEVYEEIIEDISPPPLHNILLNIVQNLPVVTTTSATIIEQDEENHIKANISDYTTENIKKYEKSTQSGRNRGNKRFQ